MHRLTNGSADYDNPLAASESFPTESITSPATAAMASSPEAIAITCIAWIATGVLVALVMIRRGHDAGAWTLLGIALGPLLLGLAAHWVRHREPLVGPLVLAPGSAHGGSVDVLVGLGPGASDLTTVRAQLAQLEMDVGRLTIASAVDFESMLDPEWNDAKVTAAKQLYRAEATLETYTPGLVILPGRIDPAVERYRASDGFDRLLLAPRRPTVSTVTRSM
jgi:hypothetical protein